ncbi:MAG: DUF2460 domain-containing protein [Pseudomonas sp.]|nr:DUF2460 domain-containing protein [Pseudomonas sp.]
MIGPFLPARWIAAYPDVSGVDSTVLPHMPGQTLLKKKQPEWATGVQEAASGRTKTTSYRASPKWHFQLGYNAVRKRPGLDEWSRLVEFFNAQKGRFKEFRYFDRYDHLVINQNIGIGDGTTVAYQLVRSINGWQEPVYAVVGVDSLTVAGVAASGYTVSELGVVTFATPPPQDAVITWSGAFCFLCQFDQDSLPLAQPFSRIWDIKTLGFTSFKP